LRRLGAARTSRDTDLWSVRARWVPTPRLQLSAFLQHNTAAELESWYLRFAWEFRPLSYAYLVYARQAPTDPLGGFLGRPDEVSDQLVLKVSVLQGL
jgi:hypothetical protein